MSFSGNYGWVKTTTDNVSSFLEVAVEGGFEGSDSSPLYVIRAWHNGDLMPGRLSIKHKRASVSYYHKEHVKEDFEILCSKPGMLKWAWGNVPLGAIPGGKTWNGEILYVGKAAYKQSVVPGKVHPSDKRCFIGYYGSETWQRDYDVLCDVIYANRPGYSD